MRVLILWAHHGSTNLGLHVLAQGTAAIVRNAWPDAHIEYQNYGKGTAPMSISSPRSLAREWVTAGAGLKAWIKSFDFVIDTRSGDSFSDIYGLRRLVGMSAMAEFVRAARVPVILGPQTIGPFESRRGRWLGRRALGTARLTMARDSESQAHAEALGRPAHLRTTDVVFALPVPRATSERDVILNVSGLLWNSSQHMDAVHYRNTVTSLHRALIQRGRTVALMAHVIDSPAQDNDVPAIREFAAANAVGAEMLVPENLQEARQILAGGTVVIGSRMHACLNALSTGTPAIPLAYSRKFAPLFRDIGWDFTVDLRSSSDPVGQALSFVEDETLDSAVGGAVQRAQALLDDAADALRKLA